MEQKNTVNLDSLSAQQLTQVKKQLDEELESLTSSFTQLHAAQSKFRECLRCVQGGKSSALQGRCRSALSCPVLSYPILSYLYYARPTLPCPYFWLTPIGNIQRTNQSWFLSRTPSTSVETSPKLRMSW